MTDATKRIEVAQSEDLVAGEPVKFESSEHGLSIALYRSDDGGVFATDDLCTHGQASLAEGWLEEDMIECPVHQGRFCIKTGKAQGFPVTEDIKTYPAEEADGAVYILLETN